MEIEKVSIETEDYNALVMFLQKICVDIEVSKNLVNGKPIDADRKLQGVLTRCQNLLQTMMGYSGGHELVDKNVIENKLSE